jgi:hypothetical protein
MPFSPRIPAVATSGNTPPRFDFSPESQKAENAGRPECDRCSHRHDSIERAADLVAVECQKDIIWMRVKARSEQRRQKRNRQSGSARKNSQR